ncbi:MAG: hypothetical protein ABSD76_02955 [Terriglobales bacterium]|jgi:hypothetical protein
MKPNSAWVITLTGLMLTAGLVVPGYALVHLHPAHYLESLTLLVDCGGGSEAHASWTTTRQVPQSSVCLERSASRSNCSGNDCGTESAQKRSQGSPDAFQR